MQNFSSSPLKTVLILRLVVALFKRIAAYNLCPANSGNPRENDVGGGLASPVVYLPLTHEAGPVSLTPVRADKSASATRCAARVARAYTRLERRVFYKRRERKSRGLGWRRCKWWLSMEPPPSSSLPRRHPPVSLPFARSTNSDKLRSLAQLVSPVCI